MTKRPPLSNVLGTASLSAREEAQPSGRQPMAQLNVSIPVSLRKAVRIKAMEEEKDVASIVQHLLEEWLDGR